MNIPEGYKLVPVEPTREMCLAAKHEQSTYPLSFDANSPVVTYRAMQPAPVAVVLPERSNAVASANVSAKQAYALGWNACLDEVTRLNKAKD